MAVTRTGLRARITFLALTARRTRAMPLFAALARAVVRAGFARRTIFRTGRLPFSAVRFATTLRFATILRFAAMLRFAVAVRFAAMLRFAVAVRFAAMLRFAVAVRLVAVERFAHGGEVFQRAAGAEGGDGAQGVDALAERRQLAVILVKHRLEVLC